MIDKEKEARIKKKIEEFIRKIHGYSDIGKDEITINPFLAEALKLKSKSDRVKFFLMQRLQRGIVTSFGTLLQGIAKILDSEARMEDIDLVITKNKVRHYIQLKSGPEGFTRPALRKTLQSFHALKKKNPRARTAIAFCYGTKEQLSPIWGKELYRSADLVLVGKEFWDYFFGKGFYEELIGIFGRVRFGRDSDFKRRSFHQIYNIVYKRLMNDKQFSAL